MGRVARSGWPSEAREGSGRVRGGAGTVLVAEPCCPCAHALPHRWMKGDGPEADAARNKKFKLIPRIVKGAHRMDGG